MSHIQEAINMLDRSLTSSNNPMMPKKLAYQVKKLLESATQTADKSEPSIEVRLNGDMRTDESKAKDVETEQKISQMKTHIEVETGPEATCEACGSSKKTEEIVCTGCGKKLVVVEKPEPKCKTCNDTKQVGEEQHYLGRSVGWKACPDCNNPDVIEKPEQGEFTKRARFVMKDTVLPITKRNICKKDTSYYIPPDVIENYFEACDIIDRLEESRTRKDEYWIRREEELGSQLKAKGEALQASLPTSMMMCPKCDINYMKPTEDMCDKCRIKQLETNLKKRLEADIASSCEIEQLQREINRLQKLTPNSPEGQEGEAV